MLLALDEDPVLALEDGERLGAVVVDVQWRPEVRWLGRLQQRECPASISALGLDNHLEVAKVDRPALARAEHDCRRAGLHGDVLPLAALPDPQLGRAMLRLPLCHGAASRTVISLEQ